MQRFFENLKEKNKETDDSIEEKKYVIYPQNSEKPIAQSATLNYAILLIHDEMANANSAMTTYDVYKIPKAQNNQPIWSGDKTAVIHYMEEANMLPCPQPRKNIMG